MAPRNTRVNPETETRSPARSFAQTLDNYYAPARDRRSEQALQQGLSGFAGVFQEKANRLKSERREDEKAQGVADAMREQAGEELKGVKTGSLFRQHSSFYMAGLNETRGKAAAERFKQETARAYEEWSGKYADDDGSGFRQFMNDRVGTFMESLGDDKHKLAGALPVINETTRNYATHHTAFTNKRLEQESMEAYDDIVSGVFNDLSAGDLDMEMAIDAVANEADMMYQTDGAKANDRVVEAAIRHANIHNDPTSILVLAKAHDKGKLKISQKNRELLAEGMDRVEADIEREANREASKNTAEFKKREREVNQAWFKQLQDDPYTDITEWIAQNEVEGVHFKDLEKLQSAYIRGQEVEDPQITTTQRLQFESDLQDANGVPGKLRALSEFTAQNPNALSGAEIARYSQEIFEATDPGSIVNDPTISRFRKGFGDTLGTFSEGNQYLSGDQSPFLKTQGINLYNQYMVAQSGKVDLSDPRVLLETHEAAEEFAVKHLTKMFPNQMSDKLTDQPEAGAVLGVGGQLEERQAEADAADAEEFRNMTDGNTEGGQEEDTLAGDTVEEPTAPTEVAEEPVEPIEIDQEVLEQEPEPFDDPETEQEYSPTRSGFYGQLIHRFTDDKIEERPTLESATTVLSDNPEFADGVRRLGTKYNVNPMALMAIMDFETGGTFNPAEPNQAGSGATGLIQFMPKTARSLGTSTAELAQMSQTEQLVYVEKYFDQFGSRLEGGNVDDLYMAVLWPKAIGKPDGYPIFRSGTIAYRQNAGLDHNKDGTVTKYEAATKVRRTFYGY